MGFDNIYLAELLERPLSTINPCISESGQMAIKSLINYLNDPNRRRTAMTIEPTLIRAVNDLEQNSIYSGSYPAASK